MELVYLWVEDYKNIQKQGFNFSPRFDCSYKNDKLKIIDKEKTKEPYLKNFFDNKGNINITAIVGKNGSGKSNILECLSEIFRIEYNKNRNLIVDDEHTFNFYLIFRINNKTYEIKSITTRDYNTFTDEEKIENILDYFIYSNNKLNIEKQISLGNSSIAKMLAYDYSRNQNFKLSSFMYLPNKIFITLCDFEKKFKNLISNNKLYPMYKNEPDMIYIENMGNEIDSKIKYFNLLTDKYHQFLILNLLEKSPESFNYDLSKEAIIKKLDDRKLLNEEGFNIYSNNLESEINKLERDQKEIYFNKYINFFEFDFTDAEERKYSDLSHGEKTLFGQLLNVYYKSQRKKSNNFFFFLDEPEIALHPNWQKQYFNEIISLCKKIKKNYHFIFASHSPFLLSDLAKENVIFLDTYKKGEETNQKEGNCKNVTNEIDINPFGANIHTLLSDGFFMEDGLMGEFAKGKINKIIRFLNGDNRFIDFRIEQIKKVIESIGEDLLRMKLLDMYYEKFEQDELEREKQQLLVKQEEISKLIQSIEKKQK